MTNPVDQQGVAPQQYQGLQATIPRDLWAGRSQGRRCRTCMFFVPKVDGAEVGAGTIGRCRRRAPTMDGFPVVFGGDWCGDHKLDEEKLR